MWLTAYKDIETDLKEFFKLMVQVISAGKVTFFIWNAVCRTHYYVYSLYLQGLDSFHEKICKYQGAVDCLAAFIDLCFKGHC